MNFLIAAYAVLWMGIFGYLVWLGGKVRHLREETAALASSPRTVAASPPPPLRSAASQRGVGGAQGESSGHD